MTSWYLLVTMLVERIGRGAEVTILDVLCKYISISHNGYTHCAFHYLLETRLQPNIAFTLARALTVFTRSDVTPPKVN